MLTTLSLLATLAIGFGAAVQTAMLGAMGRTRGPAEATWTHRFSHRIWAATAYRCELEGEIDGARFAPPAELDAVPTAFRAAIEA